jgi:molecular chaperone GrpE
VTENPDQQPDEAVQPGSLEDEAVAAAEAAATAPSSDGEVVGDTEVEEPLDVDATAAAPAGDAALQQLADERLLDLQRLQAEYVNYKRRVERDRVRVVEDATHKALAPIVEVLDTIDRAREHEELEGGFKSVADQLERVVAAAGLVKYGAPGDAFDPTVHEALSHIGTDPEVTVTTCKVIAKSGYKIGDRVVRAAQVLVVDPADA